MQLSVFAQSFLDSFGFGNMVIPSSIPGAPKYLIEPDTEEQAKSESATATVTGDGAELEMARARWVLYFKAKSNKPAVNPRAI